MSTHAQPQVTTKQPSGRLLKQQPSAARSHRGSALSPVPGVPPLNKLKSRDVTTAHRKPAAVFVAPPTSKMSENVAVYPTELKYVQVPPVVGSSAHQVRI